MSAIVPPAVRSRLASNVAGPLTVSVLADTTTFSVELNLATVMGELMVTTGFAFGPRSMMTVAVAPGTTPELQLAAVLKLPLESVFQTLTPVNGVPRWRYAFLLSEDCE